MANAAARKPAVIAIFGVAPVRFGLVDASKRGTSTFAPAPGTGSPSGLDGHPH